MMFHLMTALTGLMAAAMIALAVMPLQSERKPAAAPPELVATAQTQIFAPVEVGNLPARSLFRSVEASSPAQSQEVPSMSTPSAPEQAERVFRLVGVVTQGSVRVALVAPEGDPEIYRVMIGDNLDGWQIRSINRNAIDLVRGDAARKLELDAPQ